MKQNILVLLFLVTKLAVATDGEHSSSRKGLIFLVDQKTFSKTLNWLWDNVRAQVVSQMSSDVYDNYYFAVGDQCRDDHHMKLIWEKAFMENDDVDYVSMVHGGDQWIKEAHIPKNHKHKLRLVYSEGCGGGNGKEHFIKQNLAMVAVGHNDDKNAKQSFSPLFSLSFLRAWFNNEPLEEALNTAWKGCKENLESPLIFSACQLFVDYKHPYEAMVATKPQYSYRDAIDPATFCVNSSCQTIVRNIDDKIVEDEMLILSAHPR